MAINFCTIGVSTINSFCSPRRAAIFNNLVPILHPPVITTSGTNPRVLRAEQPYHRPFDIEDEKVLTFEQPTISVSAFIFGFTGVDSQDVTRLQTEFVSVSNLNFDIVKSSDEIRVNISNLTFE